MSPAAHSSDVFGSKVESKLKFHCVSLTKHCSTEGTAGYLSRPTFTQKTLRSFVFVLKCSIVHTRDLIGYTHSSVNFVLHEIQHRKWSRCAEDFGWRCLKLPIWTLGSPATSSQDFTWISRMPVQGTRLGIHWLQRCIYELKVGTNPGLTLTIQ